MQSKHDILIQLIDYYCNGNKAEFARKLGVKPQSINTWLSRDSFDIDLIYSKCDSLSGDWLLTGEGSMLRDSCPVPTENASEASQCKKDLAAKDELIASKDELIASKNETIKRSDKLIYSMECRIKELEDKQRYFNIEGLGDARIAEQFTLPKSGTLIKK